MHSGVYSSFTPVTVIVFDLDFNGVTDDTISSISIVGGQPPLPQSSVFSVQLLTKTF